MSEKNKIILGVDPGTVIMGFALLEVRGQNLRMLEMDSRRLNTKLEMFDRLKTVYETINGLIVKYRPQELSIEAPFFGKNVQSMLKLGRAQGVVIAAALQYGMPVTEYSPRRIKQAVTGNGNATKEKVWDMLQHILSFRQELAKLDASDALAVAVCHHYMQQSPIPEKPKGKKSGGWADFIKDNPQRIK